MPTKEKKPSEWLEVEDGWYESQYGAVQQWWTASYGPCDKGGWYALKPGGDPTAQPLGVYKTRREAQKALMEAAFNDVL